MKNTPTRKLVFDFPERALTPYFLGNSNALLTKYLSVRDVTLDDPIRRKDLRNVMVMYTPKENKYEIKVLAAGRTNREKWVTMNRKRSWTFKVKPKTSDEDMKEVKSTKKAKKKTQQEPTIVMKIRTIDFAYPLFEDGIVSAIIHQVIQKRLKGLSDNFVGLKEVEISRNLLIPMYQLRYTPKNKDISVSSNTKEMVSVRIIEFIKKRFGIPSSIPLKGNDIDEIAYSYLTKRITLDKDKLRREREIDKRVKKKVENLKEKIKESVIKKQITESYNVELSKKEKGRYEKMDEISKFLRDHLLQIFYALYLADREFGFLHGDLYVKNIMVDELDNTVGHMIIRMNGENYVVGKGEDGKIPLIKIIDFDFSRIDYEIPVRKSEKDKIIKRSDILEGYKKLTKQTKTYLEDIELPQFRMEASVVSTSQEKKPELADIFGFIEDLDDLERDKFYYKLLFSAYNKKLEFLKFLSKRRNFLDPVKVSRFYGLNEDEIKNFSVYLDLEEKGNLKNFGEKKIDLARYKNWKKLQDIRKRIRKGQFANTTNDLLVEAKKKRGKLVLEQLYNLYTKWYATIAYTIGYNGLARVNDAKTLITELLFGKNHTIRGDPNKQHYQKRLLPYIATIDKASDHKELLEFLSVFYKGLNVPKVEKPPEKVTVPFVEDTPPKEIKKVTPSVVVEGTPTEEIETIKEKPTEKIASPEDKVAEHFLDCLTFYYLFERIKANQGGRKVTGEYNEVFRDYTRFERTLYSIEVATYYQKTVNKTLKEEFKEKFDKFEEDSENNKYIMTMKNIPDYDLKSYVKVIKRYEYSNTPEFYSFEKKIMSIEESEEEGKTEKKGEEGSTSKEEEESPGKKILGKVNVRVPLTYVFVTQSLKNKIRLILKNLKCPIFFTSSKKMHRFAIETFEHERQKLIFFWLFENFKKYKFISGKLWSGMSKIQVKNLLDESYQKDKFKGVLHINGFDFTGDYEDDLKINQEIKKILRMVEGNFFYLALRNIFFFLHETDYKYSMKEMIKENYVKNFFAKHQGKEEGTPKKYSDELT